MKIAILIILMMWASQKAYGAFEYLSISARNAGLAGSYSASTEIPDAFLINPALSVNNKHFFGSLNYSRLFNLESLTYSSGMAAFGIKEYSFAFAIQNFGDALYRENRITLNASRNFIKDRLSVGLSTHFYFIAAENYDNISSVGISVGFRYRVSPVLWIGGAIENINRPKLNGYSEEMPQIIQVGLQYKVVDQLFAHINVQKDAWFSPTVSLGVEYNISGHLQISSGFSSAATLPSVGIGLHISKLTIDYSVLHHFELGPTHFVGISFLAG